MTTPSFLRMNRYSKFNRLAALAIVAGAALACFLCLANGNPAACLGVLPVFGMALIAVAGGRPAVRPPLSMPRYRVPERRATHAPHPAQPMAFAWGRAHLSC